MLIRIVHTLTHKTRRRVFDYPTLLRSSSSMPAIAILKFTTKRFLDIIFVLKPPLASSLHPPLTHRHHHHFTASLLWISLTDYDDDDENQKHKFKIIDFPLRNSSMKKSLKKFSCVYVSKLCGKELNEWVRDKNKKSHFCLRHIDL
jgi:hypothetical protein